LSLKVRSTVRDEGGYPSALIVAKSADLREGLHSLLTVVPQIGCISHARDGASGLWQVEERCPDLLLLDFDLLHEDVIAVLKEIKARCPHIQCLALTDHAHKREEVQSAGADVVLLKGHPASSLVSTITKLLAMS
jgi:DNA-binding NarL/FixJ family response regulator